MQSVHSSKKVAGVTADCFICNSKSSFNIARGGAVIAEGREFRLQFCKTCGLGRTEPFLDEIELGKMYSSVTYREDDAKRFPAVLEKAIAFLRKSRCRAVERFSVDGGLVKGRAILDVGCGRGDFLLFMAGRGWKTDGLELDSRAEGRGKKLGLSLKSGSLENIRYDSAVFDVVTFWHVFEHIRKPVETLAECRRILKPGGLLVVAVPNIAGLQARVSGNKWFHFDPPYHLYHYSTQSLSILLEKAGFEVKGVRYFSFEYNPYGWLQSFYNLIGFKHNLLYDFLRSRAEKNAALYVNLLIMAVLMPVLAPLSIALSALEAIFGMGGTIEIYAVKR
jgi:2-polyprenyl-3-methyl-5-hydroxy-6-metoxy-1,4-benzoquinol methylase